MMNYCNLLEGFIVSLSQVNVLPDELYFDKVIEIGFGIRNSSLILSVENPAFYEIFESLMNAHLTGKKILLYEDSRYIQGVKGLTFSIKDQKQKVMETCLHIFANEIDFTNISWKDYPLLTQEKKIKFWKRWLRVRMQRIALFGFDPYYLFHPKVYNFWQQQEPNIDLYLTEFIRLRNLNQHQVEANLGKKL